VRVWIPNLRESGGSTLQGELGARGFSLCVHMAPLWLGGVRGKNSTHSIGWEVLVKSRWLASGRQEGVQPHKINFRFFTFGYSIFIVNLIVAIFFCNEY
jgi:hypothetical protein